MYNFSHILKVAICVWCVYVEGNLIFSVQQHLSNSWWNPLVSFSSQVWHWDCTYLCWGGLWQRPRWRWCRDSGTVEPGSDYTHSISDWRQKQILCEKIKQKDYFHFDAASKRLKWIPLVIYNKPECLYKPLYFLGFSLNFNLCLELPQSIIDVHAWEVHLIHHTAETHTSEVTDDTSLPSNLDIKKN